ncbi:MAG: hypothetical protein ABEI77_10685 [Halorientalis sp.]
MVRTRPPTEKKRDRGQLLLVGAVIIAAIIIGLVVVINTVLVTENVAKGESLDRARDTAQFDSQARRNVRSLVLRLNHDNRTVTADELNTSVHENFTSYGRLLAETYALREPIWVNISYHNDSSTWGQRIVRNPDGKFTSPGGSNDWMAVSDYSQIGRFVLNLNVSQTETSPFYLNFTNRSGEHINISLRAQNSGGNSNILINSPKQTGAAVCESANGRVLLDVLSGTAYTGDCEFEGPRTIDLQEPYTLRITDGNRGYGKYGIVANTSVSPASGNYARCQSFPTATCTAPIIWSANVTVQYESTAILYNQDHNVSIYP